jgi:hypothetical protein
MTSSTGPFRSGLSEGSAASWRGTSPGGVREALRLRLELKRDPLAPLPAPEPPPGARWPEEFFYTWLLLVPPLEEVEGAFLYPLGGQGRTSGLDDGLCLAPLCASRSRNPGGKSPFRGEAASKTGSGACP